MSHDIMLQGFHWLSSDVSGRSWYDIIQENSKRIKDSGFTLMWFPPPSDSGDNQGYLPRELDKLDKSKYGNESDLKDAIDAIKPVKAIADIVINHRVGTSNNEDFTGPIWSRRAIVFDDEDGGYDNSINWDTGDPYHAARDLDHKNPETQQGIITWMNSLKARVGFVGWRYDLVKGYAGWATELYNKKTQPEFSVGEFWDSDPQKVVGWIDSTHPEPAYRSRAFDFPLRNALYQAIAWRNFHHLKYGDRAAGVIGLWSDKAVTFMENHDTEEVRNGEYASYFPGKGQMIQGYAYLLTHPGIPCVFWGDIYDSGPYYEKQIRQLIKIRKEFGIHSKSKLYIATAQQGLVYAAYIQGDKGEIAMKIGPGAWQPSGSKWQPTINRLLTFGNDYAVWGEKI